MENQNEQKEKESWWSKNAWWVAIGVIVFIMKMCSDIQG